ncbi:efflux transporter outer membrane subunit [Robertkochia aurantiaca]|uniref:efflux transporter outer membrane subunit n=1 Tax=Robertkochia aurantiaca TaxID=2873700 RepID=UPI001CCA902D|nr:TolC family protein [Robertkochia sp. 3YJGBD-33]
MKRSIHITAICSLLLSLLVLGCKVGRNYEPVNYEAPEGYLYDRHPGDSLREVAWWQLFNDQVLDTLIATALQNNPDLRIALENVEQAELALNIQRKELLPKITVQAGATRGNFFGIQAGQGGTSNIFTGFGNASWQIDLFGKLRRLNEAALADYLGSEYGVRAVRLTLISEVVRTYLSMRQFEESYRISLANLKLRDSSLRLIQARFDQGYTAQIELDQARIQKAIAASAVPRFKRSWLQAQNALSILTGSLPQPPDSLRSFESLKFIPDIPAGLPSELLRHRPDMLEAEQGIIAQNALVGAAIANRWPNLNLTGAAGVVTNELENLSLQDPAWSLSAAALAPLFNWGQNKRRVEIERSRLEQQYLVYERTALNAFREVEDALVAIETYQKEYKAREDHVKAALSAQYLSGERYDKGVTSYLEFLESQRQAFDAQIERVATRRLLLESYVLLYQSLGGGWVAEEQLTSGE